MPEHTPGPGPWAYQPTAGDHDFSVYEEATGRDVALVRDFNEANARLIAKAPEMLEALRNIIRDQDEREAQYPDRAVQPHRQVVMDVARAVLLEVTQ